MSKERDVVITEYPVKLYPRPHRKLKLALIEKFGVCYWCGIKVKDYPHVPGVSRKEPDMATIDHIVSRVSRKKGELVDKVLACKKCNEDRARKQQQRIIP